MDKALANRDEKRLRRDPKQERSRERVEEILRVAMQLVGEKGIDAVTMREIAAAAGGPIASLYQYFPNKSSIYTMIYEQFVASMEGELRRLLTEVKTKADLFVAASAMLDIYFGAMQAEPARLDIVIAVQADKTCLNIDLDYSRRFSTMFVDACRPFVDPSRHAALERICFMMFHLSHATVRLILSRDLDQRDVYLGDYKSVLASQLLVFTSTTP